MRSTNDALAGTVSAQLILQPITDGAASTGGTAADGRSPNGTLVALSAGPSGPAGDYSATSLSSSATWSSGGSAGDFTWSYPIRTPPSLGGPAPSVALGYSSASVDGRMAASNNQPSVIGEGFDWDPGFIERKYRSCADDMAGGNNTEKTGDLCWVSDNATLSMAGHAGELVRDSANPNRWHLRNDDGSRVERRKDTSNGDNDGEQWVVTTTDGTRYWFGRSAQSTLTVPVFGNHRGEECNAATFAASSCTQAYRWNLDYVVDTHQNTMTYLYDKETNRYARNLKTAEQPVAYDRASFLRRIDYGTRVGGSGSAPMTVEFTPADRCLVDCGNHGLQWPDTAWDQECTTSPCRNVSPTFWSTKRLAKVTTKVRGGSGYRDVESWTLTHSFKDPGDGTRAGLWLEKISHTGLVGTATTTPDITFDGVQMNNRVDTIDHSPPMNWWRIKTINTESGAKIDLTYSDRDCVAGTRVPDANALQNNVLRCYPVKWIPEGYKDPVLDFFHKYVVTDVVEADLTGGATRVHNHYDYLGTPAWHYTDDDGLTKPDYRTWSVWRGYGAVRTTKGDPGEQTQTETRYFRGMNGDRLPAGTRSVILAAVGVGNIPAVADEDAYAGMVRETITYNGPGGPEVSATVNEPWQSAPTAARTIDGVTVAARFADLAASHTRTALDGGRGYRTTTSRTTFDAYGMPVKTDNAGDDALQKDEGCILTDYARNTTDWLMAAKSRVRTFSVSCTEAQADGLTEDDIVGDEVTGYDGKAFGAPPTRGEVTRVDSIKEYHDGTPTYQTTARSTYDDYGRVVESWDVRDNKTVTEYTPTTGGPLTAVKTTGPLGWTSITTLQAAWGTPTSTMDANGRRTSLAYDGLGRLTGVWKPGRDMESQTPNIAYEYLVRQDRPTVVATKTLNPGNEYVVSYTLYDSLMRVRQTQTTDAAGSANAVVADTYYDSVGRANQANQPYLAKNVPPGVTLLIPTDVIPRRTVTVFDGAGRPKAEIFKVGAPPGGSPGGVEKWRTSTTYGGDRTDVTPPDGATATSTVTDAAGHPVALRQYHAGVPAGSADPAGFDQTTYTYNAKGQLVAVTDPAGARWDYTFDLLGRLIASVDPDKGETTSTYNEVGDLSATTDARGATLHYAYDTIGRKTSVRDGSPTGPVLAEWSYDTLRNGQSVKGQQVKSTRYAVTNGVTSAYTREILGFTASYQPSTIEYAIPAAETGLAGSYQYVQTYNSDDSLATMRLPAAGNDLKVETLNYGYDRMGKPATLKTSLDGPTTYVTGTTYTSFGELADLHLRNNAGNSVDVARTYEEDTRRLAQIWTTKQTANTTIADVRYSYDPAGNVTKMSDLTAGDHQCFTNDYLRRLTVAWTPADADCAAAPSPTALAPGGYWHTYRYNAGGSRVEQVDFATPAGKRTTTYTVPGGKHQVTGTTVEDVTGAKTADYTYDETGNTRTRPTAQSGTQTLTWDAEGHLAASTDNTGTTTYLYDADGNRLIRTDPGGKTLYLPGQEVHYTAGTGARNGVRYYTHAGQSVATRTGAGLTWLAGDHQGTTQIAVNAVNQAVSVRRQTPFGTTRASTGSWPGAMDKGFVGGTNDNTGLTHLGAREYDPTIGRFISVDPVLDIKDAQQMNGYSYANNDPVNRADPSGLKYWWQCPDGDCTGKGYGTSSPATLPEVTTDKAQPGFAFVGDGKGRTYRVSLGDKKVPQENIEVRDYLNHTVGQGLNNDAILANAPAEGEIYLANDETWKGAVGSRPDFLKLTFEHGKLVKVTTADLYEPSGRVAGTVKSIEAKQSQADEIIVRFKNAVSNEQIDEVVERTSHTTFKSRTFLGHTADGTPLEVTAYRKGVLPSRGAGLGIRGVPPAETPAAPGEAPVTGGRGGGARGAGGADAAGRAGAGLGIIGLGADIYFYAKYGPCGMGYPMPGAVCTGASTA